MTDLQPLLFFGQLQQDLQWLLEQGGVVLWAIFATCLLLWFLILERYWFIRVIFPKRLSKINQNLLSSVPDTDVSQSHWVKVSLQRSFVSEMKIQLQGPLGLIQTLIVLCPMLGLLGTVTGMVSVFEIIAVIGTSDAQAMAHGVYRATIPTMAGLVVSLSGLYFVSRIKHLIQTESHKLNLKLKLD
jgi:biopolymer transport protein ExbB